MPDSRHFVPELTAEFVGTPTNSDQFDRLDAGRTTLLAPSPGLWSERPGVGALVRSGDAIGWIEILGVAHRLRAPELTAGVVVELGPHPELARRPVDYRAPLLTLDPEGLGDTLIHAAAADASELAADGSLLFKAPSSGRFYQRPAPDKPAFVEVGQVIERGQTLGLLEVMKTFTRINYDDPKLPARARVLAIVVADQVDLAAGDVLFRLEGC